jgi:hypothetical protein
MLLFWIVILLKYPPVPGDAPSERINAEEELTPLIIMVFFNVTLVIGVVPVDPITSTWGVVTELFWKVRFWVVPPTVFEPSMTVLLFRTLKTIPAATDPATVAVTPVFGLMVKILVVLDPAIIGTTIGQASAADVYEALIRIETGQVIILLLNANIAAVRLV